jgi:hypothetical protein
VGAAQGGLAGANATAAALPGDPTAAEGGHLGPGGRWLAGMAMVLPIAALNLRGVDFVGRCNTIPRDL